jgi:hypothetical protein
MCSTWHASEARARSSETTNEFTERSSPAPRAILSPDTLVTHGARVPCPICSLRLCSLSRHTDPTAPWCRHCTCSLCISKRPPVHAAVALASSATCRAPRSTRRVLNGCSRLLCLCGPWPVPCLQHGWRCVGFDSPVGRARVAPVRRVVTVCTCPRPRTRCPDTHSHRTSATVTVHTSHDSFIGLKRGAALWSLTAVVAETGGRQRCHESADPTAVMHI